MIMSESSVLHTKETCAVSLKFHLQAGRDSSSVQAGINDSDTCCIQRIQQFQNGVFRAGYIKILCCEALCSFNCFHKHYCVQNEMMIICILSETLVSFFCKCKS